MRFRIFKWSMINIIPSLYVIHIVEDDPPHSFAFSLIQITILGYVFNIDVPWELPGCGISSCGPHWSRKKKHWRWL